MSGHKPLRIALVSEFFYPNLGGIQEHLYFFAKELIRLGHEPTIITPRVTTGREMEDWWPKDLPMSCYKPIGRSWPFFINGGLGRTTIGFFLGTKLKRLLTPKNFDIVHLHSPLNGTLPILAAHNCTTPMVGTFHSSFDGSETLDLLKKFGQRHIDRMNAITAVAPIALDSLRRYFDVDGDVIPNGIDSKGFHPTWMSTIDDRFPRFIDDKVNILFVGRPDPRNGLGVLIPAFAKVHKENPKTRLIVAGAGSMMPYYVDMANRLAPGGVEFLGAVHAERPQLYRTAHIHVFGVSKACCSLTVFEGMASGLPIVTAEFEGHDYHGTAGKHFLMGPVGDVDAMAANIKKLVDDPALRDKIGRAGRERAETLDWSLIVQRFLRIYERVLGHDTGKAQISTARTPLLEH